MNLLETDWGMTCHVIACRTREDWKAERAKLGVGSSEIAAIFGESPYDSQFSLWAKRCDPSAFAEAVERESEAMEWGTELQDVILRRYAKDRGARVFAWPQNNICVAKHFAGFATPDSVIMDADGSPYVGEVKAFSEHDRKRWSEGPPPYVVLQNMHQQEVTGIHAGKIIALFGNRLRHIEAYDVPYDETFAAGMRERVERFMAYVADRREPPADESEMTFEAIKKLHPRDNGEIVDLDERFDDLLVEWDSLKEFEKQTAARLDWIKNQIVAAIGDATYGASLGGRWLSWKSQDRTDVDRAKLQDEYPATYKDCLKKSTTRVLRTLKKAP